MAFTILPTIVFKVLNSFVLSAFCALIESPATAGRIELITALNPSAVEKAVTPTKIKANSSSRNSPASNNIWIKSWRVSPIMVSASLPTCRFSRLIAS